MTQRVERSGLQVDANLHDLIENEILPGSGVRSDEFWQGLAETLAAFAPQNAELLLKRDRLQAQIDDYHRVFPVVEPKHYQQFLRDIGYLLPEGAPFQVTTTNVDEEISRQAGPQLVVPLKNARFALNAVNARWGSLYDALYGTDAISEQGGAERCGAYNPIRGQRVMAFGRQLLDQTVPLTTGSHSQAVLRCCCTTEWGLQHRHRCGIEVNQRRRLLLPVNTRRERVLRRQRLSTGRLSGRDSGIRRNDQL